MGFGSGMGMMGGMGGCGMMGGMGGMTPMSGGTMAMMGMGGVGANEAMFKAALQSASMGQPSPSQLVLLIPSDVLQQALVPQGHLGDITQKCGIRIDLGEEVPPNLQQVTFTGSVAANAMAAYFLQERALQYSGK